MGRGDTDEDRKKRWRSFHILLVSLFMLLIDVTIVTVAVPSIQRSLHANYAQVELVLSIYQVGFAVLLITGGRLGDIYGRKRVLHWGMIGFMAASAACGLAPGVGILIIARTVQGLFAALMYPQIFAFAQELFPGEERRQAFSTLGAAVGLGVIAGPLLGGFLLQWNLFGLDWRPIFLINLLIGGYALAAGRSQLQESKAEHPPALDLGGAAMAALWLFLLAWPVTVGPQAGWPAWSWIMLAGFVPAFFGFWRLERRLEREHRSPLLDFRLLSDRAFRAGLACDLFCYFALPSFLFLLFIALQIGLGFSPLHAGLTTVPYAVAELGGSLLSARWVKQWGKGVLYLGTAAVAGGTAALLETFRAAGADVNSWRIMPALALIGFGWGTTISPLINIVLAAVRSGEAGAGSGVLTTVQRVGGAVGIGVAGMIFFGLVGAQASSLAPSAAAGLERTLVSAGATAPEAHRIAAAFTRCFVQRAHSSNPIGAPAPCRAYLPPPSGSRAGDPPWSASVQSALQSTVKLQTARTYSSAFAVALWYQVAMFLIALAMAVRMPKPDPKKIGGD